MVGGESVGALPNVPAQRVMSLQRPTMCVCRICISTSGQGPKTRHARGKRDHTGLQDKWSIDRGHFNQVLLQQKNNPVLIMFDACFVHGNEIAKDGCASQLPCWRSHLTAGMVNAAPPSTQSRPILDLPQQPVVSGRPCTSSPQSLQWAAPQLGCCRGASVPPQSWSAANAPGRFGLLRCDEARGP